MNVVVVYIDHVHLKGRGLDGDVTTIERAIARWIRVRLARRAIRNRQIGTRSALWLERRTAPRDSVSALVKSMVAIESVKPSRSGIVCDVGNSPFGQRNGARILYRCVMPSLSGILRVVDSPPTYRVRSVALSIGRSHSHDDQVWIRCAPSKLAGAQSREGFRTRIGGPNDRSPSLSTVGGAQYSHPIIGVASTVRSSGSHDLDGVLPCGPRLNSYSTYSPT